MSVNNRKPGKDKRGYVTNSFRFPPSMAKKLKQLAKQRHVSVNTLLLQMVDKFIANEKRRERER